MNLAVTEHCYRFFTTHLRIPAVAGLLLALPLLYGCDAAVEAPAIDEPPQAEPVMAESISWQPRLVRIEAVGTSRAVKSVTIYPEVSGEVVYVAIQAGDKVAAGETIVQLDERDQRLAVELARVNLADAERLYDRYRRTQGVGTVTENTLDEARSAVDRARLSLERAEVALDYRSIEAPFEGHIGITNIDAGAQVGPDTIITTIDDRSTLLVTFEVPELFLGQIEKGQQMSVDTWDSGGSKHQGEVVDIDSRVNPQTRTFAVRAHVDNSEDRLRPGMSFRVLLNLEAGRYPVVPEVALQWGNDGSYVWAVEDGKAKRVPATVVQRLQGEILVEADLPEGSVVVTEGIQNMREGLSVENIARL